jgi:hypothetical protein
MRIIGTSRQFELIGVLEKNRFLLFLKPELKLGIVHCHWILLSSSLGNWQIPFRRENPEICVSLSRNIGQGPNN